jgi:hypothetical protein
VTWQTDRRSSEPRENNVQILGYIDAGSGSMILAAIAGGVAGIGVVFKTFGRRILGVFSPAKRAALKAEQEAAAAGDAN